MNPAFARQRINVLKAERSIAGPIDRTILTWVTDARWVNGQPIQAVDNQVPILWRARLLFFRFRFLFVGVIARVYRLLFTHVFALLGFAVPS